MRRPFGYSCVMRAPCPICAEEMGDGHMLTADQLAWHMWNKHLIEVHDSKSGTWSIGDLENRFEVEITIWPRERKPIKGG